MTHIETDIYALNIENFSDSLKNFIHKVEKIPSFEYREKIKKENTKAKRHFKYFSNVVLLIIKSLLTRRKYFQESWFKSIDYDPNMYLLKNDEMRYSSILEAHESKSLLTKESLTALHTPIELRNDIVMKKIVTTLNRLNVFTKIIPKDSVIELAKRVKYQRFENGRIIAYEGQIAKNLYFILSGKINCVKKFELSDGDLYKIVYTISKGENTDPEEVEKKLKRNFLMYSKGVTEVLVLNAFDLEILRYNKHHLPLDFLVSLNMFNSYPISSLTNSSENMYYQYFGPNEIISQDAENSPWIYVIISGYVKVVKRMKLVDQNRIISAKTIKIIDENKKSIDNDSSSSELEDDTKSNTKLNKFPILENYKPSTKDVKYERELTLPPIVFSTERITNRQSSVYLSASVRRETPQQGSFLNELVENQFVQSEYEIPRNKTNDKSSNFDSPRPNTRVQSCRISRLKRDIPNNSRLEKNYRIAYVVVDRIQKGDIFGLYPLVGEEKAKIENLSKKYPKQNKTRSADGRKHVILISEGAELVMISKVSFYQYADVQTLCKIEQLEKSENKYISENEAREKFYEMDKWKNYKKKLFKSLLSGLTNWKSPRNSAIEF
ncbi:unnamed protein product [Brachionus calyciflorus]|uniref:Cyclic nucleotide-binding domain-containing protein n=1 Tax=Brachionus calyciflorus TaxID=104777 RepID=A0A813RGP9_9BILA|nr:unnamed protein product [Brachionus calyciflorus]